MGIFNSFKQAFNTGRKRTIDKSNRRKDLKEIDIPVKLVEPSTGEIIKLWVYEENSYLAQKIMFQLEAYAKGLVSIAPSASYKICENYITIQLPEYIAENQRELWRK